MSSKPATPMESATVRGVSGREVCLDTAKALVLKDRHDERGAPENTFQYIAEYWRVYLAANFNINLPLEAYHASEMMELLKMARANRNGTNPDNYFDRAGYCACSFEMRMEKERFNGN